jgi:hypothetical protein
MFLAGAFVAALVPCATPARAQGICRPSVRPANPAPVRAQSCLMQALREFGLNEETTSALVLEKGKSYWFGASGCPKMGNIGLYILDSEGAVVKQASSYSPSFCFTPRATGKYTVKAKALSLMHAYRSGTIDACFSESGCR